MDYLNDLLHWTCPSTDLSCIYSDWYQLYYDAAEVIDFSSLFNTRAIRWHRVDYDQLMCFIFPRNERSTNQCCV